MKQTNTDPKPRAYGVAMAICNQVPGFELLAEPGEGKDGVCYSLRRRDGAILHISHGPNRPRGQRDITVCVGKIPEAPYGTEEPRASWGERTSMTDSEIAFDYAMNHHEHMQHYWMVGLAAKREKQAYFDNRMAFANELARVGNGITRIKDIYKNETPWPDAIDCFAKSTSKWRVKHFHNVSYTSEMTVEVTDAQALAIVAMLAGGAT